MRKALSRAGILLILLTAFGCGGYAKTFLINQLVGAGLAIAESLTGSLITGLTGQVIPSLIDELANPGDTTAPTTDNATGGG